MRGDRSTTRFERVPNSFTSGFVLTFVPLSGLFGLLALLNLLVSLEPATVNGGLLETIRGFDPGYEQKSQEMMAIGIAQVAMLAFGVLVPPITGTEGFDIESNRELVVVVTLAILSVSLAGVSSMGVLVGVFPSVLSVIAVTLLGAGFILLAAVPFMIVRGILTAADDG